jgi:DNA ligase-1
MHNVDHRPMLAAAVDVEDLHKVTYPKILQVKYDGIRAVCRSNYMMSRSGKFLPNEYVQEFFYNLCADYPVFNLCDGELMVGDPTTPAVCMATASGIMSIGGQPDFTYYVFDRAMQGPTYNQRREHLHTIIDNLPSKYRDRIQLVGEFQVNNVHGVRERLDDFLASNLEGCILRDPHGLYKHGRSTFKQGTLLKIKDIRDAEAIIVGHEELNHNLNVATTDALGYTKRSSHKDNKVGGGKLGAFVVRALGWGGATFKVGTGFTDEQRVTYWKKRQHTTGMIIKFKYLGAGGKELPRHTVFMGFRAPADVDTSVLQQLNKLATTDVK